MGGPVKIFTVRFMTNAGIEAQQTLIAKENDINKRIKYYSEKKKIRYSAVPSYLRSNHSAMDQLN